MRYYSTDTLRKSGFTLVEMSIVLIIIGLIVAGIAKGQDMVRAGKIASVVSDINKIKSVTNLFELQYNYLPGDFPEPFGYFPDWGFSVGDAAGNGNGILDIGKEGNLFFKHLSLAEFIEGDYHNNSYAVKPSIEVPVGPFSDTAYSARIQGSTVGAHIRLGRYEFGNSLVGGALNGADAASIDKKMDDGLSRSGNVKSMVGAYIPAYTEACRDNYPLSTTDVRNCILEFFIFP